MDFAILEETELYQLSRVDVTEDVSGKDGWFTRPVTAWRIRTRSNQRIIVKVVFYPPAEVKIRVLQSLSATPARWLSQIMEDVTGDMSVGAATPSRSLA